MCTTESMEYNESTGARSDIRYASDVGHDALVSSDGAS